MNHQEREALRLSRAQKILASLTENGPEVVPVLARKLRDDSSALRREAERLCTEGRLDKRHIRYALKYRRGTILYFVVGDTRVDAAIETIVNAKDPNALRVKFGPKRTPDPPRIP